MIFNIHEFRQRKKRERLENERRERGTLKAAYDQGARAALERLKLAGPAGADIAVQPKGDEWSHGTERVQYAQRDGQDPNGMPTSEWRADMPDWLWENFTSYDHMAPGRADGSFGQEVIG